MCWFGIILSNHLSERIKQRDGKESDQKKVECSIYMNLAMVADSSVLTAAINSLLLKCVLCARF